MERKKLASFIVHDQFGEIIGKVADYMLSKGKSHVKEIQTITRLSKKVVKESLMVLIQQNLVTALIESEDKKTVRYEINAAAVITRLRFATLTQFARERFGDVAELIVAELLEHGRLPEERIVERCYPVVKDMSADDRPISEEKAKTMVHDKLLELITNHYLMRADKPIETPPDNLKSKAAEEKFLHPTSRKGKTAAKPAAKPAAKTAAKPAATSAPATTTTQTLDAAPSASTATEPKKRGRKKADETAEPKKKTKKAAEKGQEGDDAEKPKKKPGRKRKEPEPEIRQMQDGPSVVLVASEATPLMPNEPKSTNKPEPPTKRTRIVTTEAGTAIIDEEIFDTNESKQVQQSDAQTTWRVNYDHFLTQFKIEAIVKYAAEKFSQEAGDIIRVMFKLVEKPLEHTHTLSQVVSADMLIKELSTNPLTKDISAENRNSFLDIMYKYAPAVLQKPENGYQINIKVIVDYLKLKLAESVVDEKFGPQSVRIFRLLQIKKQLEQKAIAEMSMVPIRSACTLLYEMLTKGYIRLQEVPKQADHAPTKTIYLYNVNMESVYLQIANDMSQGLYNLLARLSTETQKYKDVCYRYDTYGDTLSEPDKIAYAKYRRIVEVMEHSIARLDHSVMCLTEF